MKPSLSMALAGWLQLFQLLRRGRVDPPSLLCRHQRSSVKHRAEKPSPSWRTRLARACAVLVVPGSALLVGGAGDTTSPLDPTTISSSLANTEQVERVPPDGDEVKRMLVERRAVTLRPSRRASRAPQEPTWLQQCDSVAPDQARDHANGQVPVSHLCRLPGTGHFLHPDAARGWWHLHNAYEREFGTPMCVTDSYRSYDSQEQLYAVKPGLAATPGSSNHGWGLALDLCGGVESFSSAQYGWLFQNGARYGWVNPGWAQVSGSRPEPWHWEYVG